MFSKLVRSKPLKRYVRFHSTLHIENNFRYKPAFQLLIHSKLPLYKDPSFLPRRFIKISSIKDFITYQRSWFRRSSRHITHITNSAVVLGFALIVSICLFISKLTQRTESKDKSHPLFPGEVLEKYKVGRLLGTGSFGSVYEATVKKTGEKVALKVIFRNKDLVSNLALRNEVDVMEACGRHENIVSLHEKFITPDKLIIIMDLIFGGELFEYLLERGRFSEKEVSVLMKKVCSALKHLHDRNICHNDIKPENLLLTSKFEDAVLKITDFGNSFFLSEKIIFDKPTGTSAYHAPEIILHQPCDKNIDMWSFGVVIYIMLCGVHPFDPSGNFSNAKIVLRVCNGEFARNDAWNQLSSDARNLIEHLLDPNPDTRYTADEALNHPWFGGRAPPKILLEKSAEQLKGFQNLSLLRASIVALGASLPTHVENARQFYANAPPVVSASERLGSYNRWNMDSNTYIKSFQLFDKDEKGFIGKHELRQLFRSFGQYLSDKDLRLIVAEGDLNGDGKISIQEFVGLMKRRMRSAWESGTDDLLRLFKIFDIDGNGVIDKHELRHVMDAVGHFVTEEDVEEMMLAADLDGNGSIDYNDFLTFLADLNETKLN